MDQSPWAFEVRYQRPSLILRCFTAQTNLSVTTNPKHTDEIKEYFEGAGKKMVAVASLESHYSA